LTCVSQAVSNQVGEIVRDQRYVYVRESIVREILGEKAFALPIFSSTRPSDTNKDEASSSSTSSQQKSNDSLEH